MKVKCINLDSANQSKSKLSNLKEDVVYKSQELGNYLYMIWYGRRYMGTFNRSNFEVKS